MSTFSLEDFYLNQIRNALNKNRYSSSSWERIQEKSSTWMCYIYSENEFIGKLTFNFKNDFSKDRLIPLKVDIDFDTHIKRYHEEDWFATTINNYYKYSCTFDLNKEDSLKIICNLIIKLVFLPKKPWWNIFLSS